MVTLPIAALERGLWRFITAAVLLCTAQTMRGELAVNAAVPKLLAFETLRGPWARVKTLNSYSKVQMMVDLVNFLIKLYLTDFNEERVYRSLLSSR